MMHKLEKLNWRRNKAHTVRKAEKREYRRKNRTIRMPVMDIYDILAHCWAGVDWSKVKKNQTKTTTN